MTVVEGQQPRKERGVAMTKANWNYPTAVKFGPGRIAELPEALKTAGISRPLLVTDAGLVNLPVTQKTIALLKDAGIPVGRGREAQPHLGQC
jgi:alcohol dehydrogenase